MAQHSIEEVFRTIAPSRRRGIPNAPDLSTGVTGGAGELATSLSQAGTEIAQLRASYQQQSDLIAANTRAVQSNTSAQGSNSVASTVGRVASGIFGGGLGLLSPVISGLAHLFGGSAAPTTLTSYTPPPPVTIGGILHSNAAGSQPAQANSSPTQASGSGATTYAPQITVHVNAMDSQSFMDRSGDIANAVREAMLNNHPINGVVAEL